MLGIAPFHPRRSVPALSVVALCGSLILSGCGETPIEADADALRDVIEPTLNVYDTSYDYGTYYYSSDVVSTDPDVNDYQNSAYEYDQTAFDPYSRDWSDPNAEGVYNFPLAVAAARASAAGLSSLVGAGRALSQTSSFRQSVAQGARYARDVTAGVAGGMLVGRWPWANTPPAEIPESEFDFMFDYATQ